MSIKLPFNYRAILLFLLSINCNPKKANIEIEYYSDKTVKNIIQYNEEGVKDGQSKWFFKNGNLEALVKYKNGKENGNAYYFYESGALKNMRHWRNGKMNGYVVDYHDDTVGMIKSVILFNDHGHVMYKKNYDSIGRFIN